MTKNDQMFPNLILESLLDLNRVKPFFGPTDGPARPPPCQMDGCRDGWMEWNGRQSDARNTRVESPTDVSRRVDDHDRRSVERQPRDAADDDDDDARNDDDDAPKCDPSSPNPTMW